MNVKLSNVGFFGSHDSWSIPDVHSSRGLKAIVAIQTTGTSAITDARPINRYRPAPRNTLDRSMPSPLSLWTQYYSHDLQPRDKSNLRRRRVTDDASVVSISQRSGRHLVDNYWEGRSLGVDLLLHLL